MDTNIRDLILKQQETRSREEWLRSEPAYFTIGGLSLFPESVLWARNVADYREWEGTFEQGYEDLAKEISVGQQELRQRLTELLNEYGYTTLSEARDDPRLAAMIQTIRQQGVAARWEYEKFFAQEGGVGARRALTYIGKDGEARYSEQQYQSLLKGEKPYEDGQPLEGHHINSVASEMEGSRTSAESLDDPENVRLMSRSAHFNNSEYGHGGDTRNPTSGESSDVTEKHDLIKTENRTDMVHEPTVARELPIVLATGLISGSISAMIEFWKLRNDPRPWKKKTAIIAGAFALGGVGGALTASAALLSKNALAESGLSEFLAESVAESAANIGFDLSQDSIQNLLGSAVGFEAIVVVRFGVGFARGIARGNSFGDVWKDRGTDVIVATGENIAFIIMGVALDSAIPDPTGIVIACRVAYSFGKKVIKKCSDEKSKSECLSCRLRIYYEQAEKSLQITTA